MAGTFGEANTVVFLFVELRQGSKSVLARALPCAENCFRGHW